jgi:hypothetical protein
MTEAYEGYLSVCCDAVSIDEVDIDSVDGDYGVPYVVANGQCSDCLATAQFYFNLKRGVSR